MAAWLRMIECASGRCTRSRLGSCAGCKQPAARSIHRAAGFAGRQVHAWGTQPAGFRRETIWAGSVTCGAALSDVERRGFGQDHCPPVSGASVAMHDHVDHAVIEQIFSAFWILPAVSRMV